jgi:exopolyphosphatase / guanosine-5'-triphosphate,3'-diphosphate pyrophosphatase
MAAMPDATDASLDRDSRWPGQLVGIDMGSNSFRLEVGQLIQGRYRRIDYLKETVRLGAGLDENGMLTPQAAQRGLDCLARFASRLQGFLPRQIRAVATQTLREARNRDAFLVQAQAALGHEIEVISGREEARLIYKGVARLHTTNVPRLVVDIGGRSTEMILGQGRDARQAESFGVGCVGLSVNYFPDGAMTAAAFRAAQVAAGAQLEEGLETFARSRWQEALGSSGTVSAVSQLLAASGITDGRITPDGLRWLILRCIEAGNIQRLALPGLKEERRFVIAGGLAILYTLASQFGVEDLRPTQGALRQGLIFDLDERRQAASLHQVGHDVRDASVRDLQRRFMVDTHQAQRVTRIAQRLYKRAQPHADVEANRELLWACALHEMGMMVSHHDHHRHSAYLLAHVDAAGFSQSQLRRLSALLLGQRGGLRKVETPLLEEAFAWQLLCLRLAIIKCHARGEVDASAIRLEANARDVVLRFPHGWSEAKPRSVFLFNEEVQFWDRTNLFRLELQA